MSNKDDGFGDLGGGAQGLDELFRAIVPFVVWFGKLMISALTISIMLVKALKTKE